MTSPSSSGVVAVGLSGDLTITAGKEERQFLVCSKTLARASPVFKAMLYGNFKEARPASLTEPWVVELPEDDAHSSEVLFNIIHSNFDRIPDALPLQKLFDILVVTDKYDMT